MGVDVKKLEELLEKWQELLRLRDWDISIQIVDKAWRKSGDIKIDTSNKKAVMLINNNPRCTNLDELVVHELLHLKLWGMDQMIEELINLLFGEDEKDKKREFAMNQFFGLLEPTVEDLAKAFLEANGCKEELSFGILKKLIDDEIGSN